MHTTLEFHPAAALFPMMERTEFQKLADDIKAHGLLEPISLFQGLVLDGRNRLEACKLTGVDPRFEHIDNISSPTVYVVSKNLHRRHLTVGQRSAVAADMIPLLRDEAKARQMSGLKHGDKLPSTPIGVDGDRYGSNAAVAKAVDVGESSVTRAIAIKKADPEVFEQMKRGEITNWAAHEQVLSDKKKESSPQPNGRIADSHKRRMEEGLSLIGGACNALNKLNLEAVAALLTKQESAMWIEKAAEARSELFSFIQTMRKGATNGTGN